MSADTLPLCPVCLDGEHHDGGCEMCGRESSLAGSPAPAGGAEETAAPTDVSSTPQADDGWHWWGGASEEWCTIGPCRSRDQVIADAIDGGLEAVHLCEARQDPLRLADWIEAEELLDRADQEVADSDRVGSENDDGPWFDAKPDQKRDLVERIKRACDEWQAAHGLVFIAQTFSDSRNHEYVVLPALDGGSHDL